MARSVAIVFEQDYSEELERLAFRTPVWLVDTPANRAAAEHVMLGVVDWPHLAVTLFRETHDWRRLLEQIALRERFEGFEVIGCALTDNARTALSEAGFERIDHTREGFRARRL